MFSFHRVLASFLSCDLSLNSALHIGLLSLRLLRTTSVPCRLTGWGISVASNSLEDCVEVKQLLVTEGQKAGMIQGKSDWQVPIILSTIPRQKSLLWASHFISWSVRMIWLSARILHTALTAFPVFSLMKEISLSPFLYIKLNGCEINKLSNSLLSSLQCSWINYLLIITVISVWWRFGDAELKTKMKYSNPKMDHVNWHDK